LKTFIFFLFLLGLTIFELKAQNADVYFNFSNQKNAISYPEGGFDGKENLIICADDIDHQRILIQKYDTNHRLIDSTTMPCINGDCIMNNALVTEENIFIVVQEQVTWDKRELRLLVYDNKLSIVKDSVFLPYKWPFQYSVDILETHAGNIIVCVIVAGDSRDTTTGTAIFKFSQKGMLMTDTVLTKHFASTIGKEGHDRFLVTWDEISGKAGPNNNGASILDSNFKVLKYFDTDSSEKHYIDWANDIQVIYRPSSNDYTNVFSIKPNVITSISTFEIDTIDIGNPNSNFKEQQVMRVAQTSIDDSLISEFYFISDTSLISTVYDNYALLADSSFLVFGVTGVGKYYEPLTPITSSYLVAKFDRNAKLLWKRNYSLKNYFYHGTQILSSKNGRIALLGSAYDYSGAGMNFGNVLFLDSNGVVEKEVGVGQVASTSVTMSIYPNPVSEFFSIDFTVEGYGQINIINTSGQVMLKKSIIQGQNKLDASELSSGMYFYQIIGKDQHVLQSGKVVKN